MHSKRVPYSCKYLLTNLILISNEKIYFFNAVIAMRSNNMGADVL